MTRQEAIARVHAHFKARTTDPLLIVSCEHVVEMLEVLGVLKFEGRSVDATDSITRALLRIDGMRDCLERHGFAYARHKAREVAACLEADGFQIIKP